MEIDHPMLRRSALFQDITKQVNDSTVLASHPRQGWKEVLEKVLKASNKDHDKNRWNILNSNAKFIIHRKIESTEACPYSTIHLIYINESCETGPKVLVEGQGILQIIVTGTKCQMISFLRNYKIVRPFLVKIVLQST